MQPDMVAIAARQPKRALWLITSSMLGPGVAETTKAMATNNHQVCRFIYLISYGSD
jgi:hypothetical protein